MSSIMYGCGMEHIDCNDIFIIEEAGFILKKGIS
jgi:hypothetical protein